MKNSMEQKGLGSVVPSAELPVIVKKICTKCKKEKVREEFYRSKWGLQSWCKQCKRESKRKTGKAFLSDKVPDGLILCSICNEFKEPTEDNFHKSKLKSSSKVIGCRACRNEINKMNINREEGRRRHKAWRDSNRGKVRSYSNMRKSKVKIATPKWFESESVEKVYQEAANRGWQVDHIVPIISGLVCGLHCHANLQILEPSINMSKKNRYWPDMP
jgi:hypothetical protein